MRRLNYTITGVLMGILIGLWIGVNIGKNRPMFTNPFQERGMARELKEKGESLMQEGGEQLEGVGKAMQEQVKD